VVAQDVIESSNLQRVSETACWAVRAKDAERLASRYADGALSAAQRREAEQMFRLLRYDGEIWVRRVVADALKECAALPAEIALLYAEDHEEVAAPLIERSPALRDADLIAIVRQQAGAHRVAVARRRRVPARVAETLCRCGENAAVTALLANPGAELSSPVLHSLLDRCGEWPGIAQAVARRLIETKAIGSFVPRGADASRAFQQLVHVVDASGADGARGALQAGIHPA
jgi:uncharacterized protein (DUF2336 family)